MFALIENNAVKKYPFSVFDLRVMFPNVSFPKTFDDLAMESYGAKRVYFSTQPEINKATQALVEGLPAFDAQEQRWTQVWSTRDLTQDEQNAYRAAIARDVRAQRNEKLAATDWTQLTDAPVNSALWATYRQALRDVTSQAGFPWEITWPTQPTE